jgi:succinate-semialdehyde dehydrogenase/glutarate-semialdehyde dehydrogenase
MQAYTQNAVDLGATVLTGGHGYDSAGNFFAPTVLDRVTEDSDVGQSEIFGPIAAIQRFGTEAEAITRANATEFGLAGYVFTENLDRALNVADSLQTGIVGINPSRPTLPPPSEASSSQASDAKEAPKASKNTKTSASTT